MFFQFSGLYRLLCSGLAKVSESVQDHIGCEDEERVPGIHRGQ